MPETNTLFLRRALVADGALSGACAPLFIFAAPLLENILGVSESLLRWAGISLVPFAIFVVALSRRDSLAPSGVWSVIAMNLAWVVASFALILTGTRSNLGSAFIAVQAIAVLAFAEIQYLGLRRAEVLSH
jgi:hypothetical protein